MNCHEAELRVADALGGELSDHDRRELDAHLAGCDACRDELARGEQVLGVMRTSISAPTINLQREGDRLVLSRRVHRPRFVAAMLKYAAVIGLSFLGGVALDGRMLGGSSTQPIASRGTPASVSSATARTRSVESALVAAYQRNPRQPDLAKCMVAVLGASR